MTTPPTFMAVDDSTGELALWVKSPTPVGYRVHTEVKISRDLCPACEHKHNPDFTAHK